MVIEGSKVRHHQGNRPFKMYSASPGRPVAASICMVYPILSFDDRQPRGLTDPGDPIAVFNFSFGWNSAGQALPISDHSDL
jgi:hypothetical protein